MGDKYEAVDQAPEPSISVNSPGPKRVGLGISVVALVIAVSSLAVAIAGLLSPSLTDSSSIPVDANESESLGQAPETGISQKGDPTIAPDSIPDLIDLVSESVVWVDCPAGAGTGWVIDTAANPNVRPSFKDAYEPESMVLVVTAEHVIRSCVKKDEDPDVFVGERPVAATLLNWRKKTDIALVAIKADVPGLSTTVMTPQAAWAMSIGFPWEFEKTVPLLGHVVDQDSTGLLLQMVVQPGNSGSPVVNSQGQAMGTVVASLGDEGEDYSLGWTNAVPIEELCGAMFLCDKGSITKRSG
ncbi:serine protease [bacterium]|nr:serine protease [bacterium]